MSIAGTASPDQQAVLTARDIHLSYGSAKALTGASLDVRYGEVLALVGPSGSGKSSLLHCMAGLLRPEHGEIRFAGDRIDDLNDKQCSALRRRAFGFVFQFGSLVPELSALENVALPLRLLGQRQRKAEATARDWLEHLNLMDLGQRRPGQLSGGQGQRVAIARALIALPQVVFADEPTGALDRANSDLVADTLLRAARERGTAVVLVTHDLALAARADRQLCLKDGLIEHEGVVV